MRLKSRQYFCLLYMAVGVIFSSCCYSFKGVTIGPEVNTYYVENFVNAALDAPLDIEVRFAESLRAKVRNESKLKYSEVDPDIVFGGEISSFRIDYEAAEEGNTVALNKLTINIRINYTNNKDANDKWSKSYSNFRTYDSTSDFAQVADQIIKEIFDQTVESAFNDAFTNW